MVIQNEGLRFRSKGSKERREKETGEYSSDKRDIENSELSAERQAISGYQKQGLISILSHSDRLGTSRYYLDSVTVRESGFCSIKGYRRVRIGGDLPMKKILLIVVLGMFLSGCGSAKRWVLTESEQYYFIPKGTEFNAVIIKGQAPVPIVRSQDTWAVDAGFLAELHEEANRKALEGR